MSREPRNISRRQALKGAAAAGVTFVVLDALAGCSNTTSGSSTASPVVVSSDEATDILTFSEADSLLTAGSTWKIPLGCVLHPGEGTWVPILATGTSADPVATGDALSLSSGKEVGVVTATVSGTLSTVIYDVRCSDSVYAWVEVDTRSRSWSLFASGFSGGALTGTTATLWQGDSNYDPPQFCCTGSKVFWLVMPSSSGSKTTEHSGCYVWHVGDSSAKQVVDSPGRFATPPTISGDTITLTPRVNASSGVYYGITAYSTGNDCSTQIDQLVMPASVKPFRAVRMGDKFAFSVSATYSSGGLLSNMGTYIGSASGPFVMLSREPFDDVSGKGDIYIIKSKASYFVADLANKQYAVLLASDHSVDYGEYPACAGTTSTFVTYATIKDSSSGYPTSVTVRTFSV